MVSVLMCTYNRENFLRKAIDSVLNQTYKDFEFVIVDDGSTDSSKEIIESYHDKRIKYIPLEKNSYYCFAANYGLQYCTGKYVAFMNSDDVWAPEKLEKQVAFMEQHKEYGACFTKVCLIDNAGNDISDRCVEMRDLFATNFATQKEWLEYFLYHGNALCHPSSLIRKDLLDKVGWFHLLFCQLGDYDLWIRIATEAPICVLQEPLIKFRWDLEKKNQISSATEENTARSCNEQHFIRRNMIERMTDEQFKTFFSDKFKNPKSSSHLEIEFEKAFLLAECMAEALDWKILGIEKLEKVLQYPNALETLREHFGLDIFDIYEWNKPRMYRDPWILNECEAQKQEIARLNEECKQSKILCTKLEEEIACYRESTSWKMTMPFRMIGTKIREGMKKEKKNGKSEN